MDLLRVRGTSADALSPTDLHAQAAMIQTQLNRLKPEESSSTITMYGRGIERTAAMMHLSEHLWPKVREAGVPSMSATGSVIAHWATKRPSIRTLAQRYAVSYRQVCAWRAAVLRAWLPIQTWAAASLFNELWKAGLQFDG